MLSHLSIPGVNLGHSFIQSTDIYWGPILVPKTQILSAGYPAVSSDNSKDKNTWLSLSL